MIGLTPVRWLVTDERGNQSIHHEKPLAERYATQHLRHGTVDGLVRVSDVERLIEQLFEVDGDGGAVGGEA